MVFRNAKGCLVITSVTQLRQDVASECAVPVICWRRRQGIFRCLEGTKNSFQNETRSLLV